MLVVVVHMENLQEELVAQVVVELVDHTTLQTVVMARPIQVVVAVAPVMLEHHTQVVQVALELYSFKQQDNKKINDN
jgi:hypothetical protein